MATKIACEPTKACFSSPSTTRAAATSSTTKVIGLHGLPREVAAVIDPSLQEARVMNVVDETCELQQFEQPRPVIPPKLIERCVIVARQHDGYGLTVTGGFPVKVGSVRPGGAAFVAGVREGDCILKVNGMPVTALNHQEILRMISGGYNVALSLIGPPRTLLNHEFRDGFGDNALCLSPAADQKEFAKNNGSVGGGLEPSEIRQRQELLQRLATERASQVYRFDGCKKAISDVFPTRPPNVKVKRHLSAAAYSDDDDELIAASVFSDNENTKKALLPLLSNNNRLNNSSAAAAGNGESNNHIVFPHKTLFSTNLTSDKVEPVKSWVESGGLHYGVASTAETSIPAEEEDGSVIEDVDSNGRVVVGNGLASQEESGPFADLQDLKTRLTHLAVFISHLMHGGGNPSSLLFYLITDHYPSSSPKDIRRYAYEIFSAFLIPNAPLHVPNISQQIIQAIDKVLRAAASSNSSPLDVEQMKRIFFNARTRVIGDINTQLIEFRRKKHADGLSPSFGLQLIERRTNEPHGMERICEQVLFKLLEELLHLATLHHQHGAGGGSTTATAIDVENCEPGTLALIIAVGTIIKVVLALKPSNSTFEKLLDKCPTFLTPVKTTGSNVLLSKVRAPMLGGKRTMQVKDHNFALNPVLLTIHCYHCREVVWGVNPHAYFCQNCDVVVHKQCTARLVDNCYPATQQKSSGGSSAGGASSMLKSGVGGLGLARFRSAAALNKPQPPPSLPTTTMSSGAMMATAPEFAAGGGRCLYVPMPPTGSMSSSSSSQLPHPHQQRLHRISDAHSAITSVSGYARAAAAATDPYHRRHHRHQHHHPSHSPHHHQQQPYQRHKESISLTPPLSRSHRFSTNTTTAQKSAHTTMHEDEDQHTVDDDGASSSPHVFGIADLATSNSIPALKHAVAESVTSPPLSPLSSALLPPRVFRTTRIDSVDLPPDLPPPPPPLECEEPSTTSGADKPLPVQVSKITPARHHRDVTPVPGKSVSSDSGIEKDASGGMTRVLPARTQSTKSDGTTKVRRVGRVIHSLGATDSPTAPSSLFGVAEETSSSEQQQSSVVGVKPSSSLAVPEASKSGASSSAPDLQKLAPAGGEVLMPSPTAFGFVATASLDDVQTTTVDDEEARRMFEQAEARAIADWDSDLDVENEVPSLESQLSWEFIKHMKPKEKKRQEVISEFFHTERTHVRNLKVLYKVFYRPMVLQRIVKSETIKLLFSNLLELLEIHSSMYQRMKRAKEVCKGNGNPSEGLFGDVGDLMENLFGYPSGDQLMQATSVFCAHQQHALDTLRQRHNRSKDDPLSAFLMEAENNSLCRKFQLKDMIPVEMQRLVKYPLLLENIAKYTPEPSDEIKRLQNSVQSAKRILSAVNSAKRTAENQRRLVDLQRRLEIPSEGATFFQKFDFRQYKLVYDGPLQWRQARGKTIDLHVILLEHLLVFLTKVGDSGVRLQLKIHETGCIPVMKLSSVEVEEKAGDKRSLNLLYKCDLRIFELVAITTTERKTWCRLIENQAAVSRSMQPETDLFGDSGGGSFSAPNGNRSHAAQQVKVRVVGEDSTGDRDLVTARIEQVQVLTHQSLVGTSELLIQQPTVLENSPSFQDLSLAERLRRHDQTIIKTLVEKHTVLAQIISEDNKVNPADLERISEQMTGLSVMDLKQRNPKELAMSAIVHGNRLLDSISKGMSSVAGFQDDERPKIDAITERHLPSVPCYKLTAIAAPLINHLKALMQVVQEQECECASLRQQIKGLQTADGDGDTSVVNPQTPVNNNTVVLKSSSMNPSCN